MANLGKIVAIDLFCGVGGLTYGLEKAGIHVAAGIDVDPACQFPYEANTSGKFILSDIATVTVEAMNKLFGDAEVRLLAGCAPCQPFSSHSKGRDTSKDPKWPLLDHFARLIQGTNPHLVTMENVVRIQGHAVFSRFVRKLQTAGYEVVWGSLYCPDYGIPQERRRLVLMASRIGGVELPKPSHTPEKYVTVRKAIGDLPKLAAGQADRLDRLHAARNLTPINIARLQHSVPGGTWLDWPRALRSPCHTRKTGSSFKSVYGRMAWDLPAPTITTQYNNFGTGRFGHPTQDRALSLREGAILQSFPPDYQFCSSEKLVVHSTVARLIGNAVPPRLGQVVGKAFKLSMM